MELLNVVRKSSSTPSSNSLEKKSFRKASKVLFSALLCSAEFESLKGAPEGELNKKKAIMGSLWCDQSTFSVSLNGYIIYRRIHFFITHELEPPIVLFATEKSHFKKSRNNVNNAAQHSFSIHSFMLANEHFFEKY